MSRVDAILLSGIAYHRQVTEYACGDASSEMVLHSFGLPDLDQRSIIDCLRTTSDEGTLSYDIRRGMHFSYISSSPVTGLFPKQTPLKGWGSTGQRVGLAAFDFRNAVTVPRRAAAAAPPPSSCWTDALEEMLERGFPVIVLQHYSTSDPGGHFRVVVGTGADGAGKRTVIMHDPWDRSNDLFSRMLAPQRSSDTPRHPRKSFRAAVDIQPQVLTMSEADFCSVWNYPENNLNATLAPYFGVAAKPWEVTVSQIAVNPSGYQLQVEVTYPYPLEKVLDEHLQYVATDATIELDSPDWMIVNGSNVVIVGKLLVGSTVVTTFDVEMKQNQPPSKGDVAPSFIIVRASGTISGSLPATFCGASAPPCPAYSYTDRIGGHTLVELYPNFMYEGV